jgi:predicted ATP-dependent protease
VFKWLICKYLFDGGFVMVGELSPEKVRSICDPNLIRCRTTEDLVPSKEIIGQERAIRAFNFGLGIKERGFNIYVAGLPGTGRTTAAKNFLEEVAQKEKVPPDWCYVYDFSHRYEPQAIGLPSGKGKEFQRDMKSFIENARTALPKAFESEDYVNRRDAAIHTIENRRKEFIDKINTEAQKDGFAIQSTHIGLVLIPVLKGKPVSNEEFVKLPPKVKEEIEQKRGLLESELRNAMRQLADMEKEASKELQKMNHDVALFAIGQLVNDLTDKYKEFPEIAAYLRDVQNDILDNLPHFLKEADTPSQVSAPWTKEIQFRKYEVNVIVDNSDTKGAPVVAEFNPTYPNLFGRVEKEAQFGTLVTDFTMIRGGSLHRVNGGYLILRVEELLRNPFTYDGLKRALKNQQIAIEEP